MTPEDFEGKLLKIEKLYKRLPDIAGIEAVKLFQENFALQGWQGTQFQPWQRKKRDNNYNILRSKNQNSLMDSIHIAEKTTKSVTIATADNKPYARIHNEGGVINVPVTTKMRKWAWAISFSVILILREKLGIINLSIFRTTKSCNAVK